MATMRCPWCGSPATVKPNGQWECGYCGDCGNITLPTQQTQQTNANVLDTITKLTKAAIPNWDTEAERLCGCVLFYELSLALTRGAALTADARQTIEGLCQQTGKKFCSGKEILRAAESKVPLFSAEAALSESECGTFWKRIIATLPLHRYSDPFPDAVADLLNCAEELYAYFFGKNSDDQRRTELWDGLQQHWIRYGVLHPDGAAAKDAIHQQDFDEYEHAYRDLLVATYPELLKDLEPLPYNELDNLFEDDLLKRTYPKNPSLAIAMWRLLLDTAAEHLLEPEVAERLIQDDMETVWNGEDCTPILDALEADDAFAKQLFRNAAPCEAQSSLLQLCIREKRKSLYQKLQTLAGESAAPTEALGILMKKFPQIMTDCPLETFQDMDERDILTYYYPIDPTLAIQMWRCLLDADGVNLHDPQTANRLIRLAMASIWDSRTNLTPLLDELERDPRFAKQLMQCAYVGVPQKYIFRACVSAGKMELLDSLQARLKNSSYPQSNWYRSWDDLQGTIEKRREQMTKSVERPVTPTPADGPTYRYCQVRFPKVPRPYSYLAEDDSIQAGDWVLAPFGRENADRAGQVEEITVCTAATALYPPERTKHITSKTDAPPEPIPAPQAEKKSVPPTEKGPEKQAPEPERPKAAAASFTAAEQKALPIQTATMAAPPAVPKRSLKKLWITAASLLLALLLAGGTYYYLDSHYDAARSALIAEDYALAETELQRLPAFFRDTQALSQFAQAGPLVQSDAIPDLEQAENLLVLALDGYDGAFLKNLSAMKSAVSAKLELRRAEELAKERALIYDQALTALTGGKFAQAEKLLKQLPADYEDVSTLTVYAHAARRAESTQSNVLTAVLSELKSIPTDYAGAFAIEIVALRDSLPQKIADTQAAEEALAQQRAAEEAARQAEAARRAEEAAQAAQSWKPPFNSGTGGKDDGAGSGNSLREDYGDPEDLYEDGDYEDLDEAWDEWEEGW